MERLEQEVAEVSEQLEARESFTPSTTTPVVSHGRHGKEHQFAPAQIMEPPVLSNSADEVLPRHKPVPVFSSTPIVDRQAVFRPMEAAPTEEHSFELDTEQMRYKRQRRETFGNVRGEGQPIVKGQIEGDLSLLDALD